MVKNSILLYRENKKIVPAIYLEEKNGRYRIQSENGKMFYIQPDDVIMASDVSTDIDSFKKLTLHLTPIGSELWETIHELSDSFELEELCSLIHDKVTIQTLYSLIHTLQENPMYFSVDMKQISVRSKEETERLLLEKQRIEADESEKIEREQKARQIILDSLKNNSLIEQYDDAIAKILTPIREFCIKGDEYSGKNQALSLYEELCKEATIQPHSNALRGVFTLALNCRIFKNYEEILLRRFSIKTSYNPTHNIPDPRSEERQDLTEHFSFTIDSAETEDIDDALSCIPTNTGYKFYIHIADPDSLVTKGSDADRDALARGISVYLTSEKYPMFPPELSYNYVSLIEGEIRNTLSLCITTDTEYKILSRDFCLTKIKVQKRLTYHESDLILKQSETELHTMLKHFAALSTLCRQKRENDDALMIENNDLRFHISPEGLVTYSVTDPNTLSHMTVQEMMILYNKTAAEYCITHALPAIFISQESPNEPIKGKRNGLSRNELIQIFPKLKKSVIGTTPGPHYCMGLSYYTQSTSPIRRYLDLVIHRILKASLANQETPYTEDELRTIIATLSVKTVNASMSEKESIRFWAYMYISQNKDKAFTALVIKRIPGGVLCEIEDLLIRIQANGAERIEPGELVTVHVSDVFPYTGEIKAKYTLKQ